MVTYSIWMKSDMDGKGFQETLARKSKLPQDEIEGLCGTRYQKGWHLYFGGQDPVGSDAGAGQGPLWSIVPEEEEEDIVNSGYPRLKKYTIG